MKINFLFIEKLLKGQRNCKKIFMNYVALVSEQSVQILKLFLSFQVEKQNQKNIVNV
jgi:regulatory protein YycI of two-component signal transduction system YycFG